MNQRRYIEREGGNGEKALISEGNGLLRLHDVRGEERPRCSSNRGQDKGKAMEAARLVYRLLCQQCRRPFDGIGKAAYCSNACRQKAKRARAKVAHAETEQEKTADHHGASATEI